MTGDLILIVEDEPAVARGLEFGLREEGFRILRAETGEQALNFTRSHDLHLILLDTVSQTSVDSTFADIYALKVTGCQF